MFRSTLRQAHVRHTLPLAGTFLLLLPFWSVPINAQTPTERIYEFAESASGFTLMGDIEVGALQAERQMTFPLTLTNGVDYMMVGFCDSDCGDLDLILLDSSGTELESDRLVDAEPVIFHTPEHTGTYTVRLDMVTCSIEPCSYAVGIFEGSLAEGYAQMQADMTERMNAYRDEMTTQGYTEMGSAERGSLSSQQEIRFPLELISGTEYKLFGVCDDDCEDMDLILFDPSGEEVASDILVDAVPMLTVTAPVSGGYRVAAVMVSCSIEPCGYEIATFARGEAVGPGGIVLSGNLVFEATYQGTLESGDEQLREGEYFDEYSVEAEAGQTVVVDLRSPDFDTYLILEAPGGDSERNDDYSGDTMRSHIEMVASESGTFSILVTTFSAESVGDYTLHVAVVEGT